MLQRTIEKRATLTGPGLFLGKPAHVTFKPAPSNHGIVFVRRDLDDARIPATIAYLARRSRRSAVRLDDAIVETTEHLMSALAGLGIDNLEVELDGPELPGLDGSSLPYLEALRAAGVRDCDAPRRPFSVAGPIVIRQDEAMITALPNPQPRLEIVYDLDYGDHPFIGRQLKVYDLSEETYAAQIAPSRTFVLEAEARALKAAGVGSHLTENDILVLSDQGPMGNNALRFSDEPVRHKILDLIGDLYLLGAPLHAKILAYRSGHAMNHRLVQALLKQSRGRAHHDLALHRNVLDIRKLHRILPHRYPMLLVDRVVELDGDRRAVGVKNVTVNEPFFTGHYPGTPIMPGVLIVEAMAQLSGVLIGQKLENMGKLAVMLSLDRVKLRRPVTPGDQLVIEAEAIRVRSRIAHMRCRAYVGEDLAAEAEVKFMLVDDEQES